MLIFIKNTHIKNLTFSKVMNRRVEGTSKNRSERSRCCAEKRSNARAKRGSQAKEMPAQ